MARPERRGAGRSTPDEWLQAGFALLAEDGFTALKIDTLSTRLGMTKGSFYWHFADMAAYKAALVSAWAQWRDDDHRLDTVRARRFGARHFAIVGITAVGGDADLGGGQGGIFGIGRQRAGDQNDAVVEPHRQPVHGVDDDGDDRGLHGGAVHPVQPSRDDAPAPVAGADAGAAAEQVPTREQEDAR